MAWSGGSFTRTNGTNSGASTWQNDAAGGTKILSSRHDTHDQDLADGINACINKAGANSPTANLPMAGYKHTAVGNGAARDQYSSVAQIQDAGLTNGGTSGGSADAQTLTLTPAITAYASGSIITFKAGYTNATTTPTMNINTVGAVVVKNSDGVALVPGDITTGSVYHIYYNGSNWLLLNPSKYRSVSLTYNESPFKIAANTADASDTKSINVCGGGDASSSRGAWFFLNGNETASEPGSAFFTSGAAGSLIFRINEVTKFTIAANGLIQLDSAAIVATGTDQGTAASLTNSFNVVSDADGVKGVKLPTPTAAGQICKVANPSTTGALKIYPQSGGDIHSGTGSSNPYISINDETIEFTSISTTSWWVVR